MEAGYTFVPCSPRVLSRSISIGSLESGRGRLEMRDASHLTWRERRMLPQTVPWQLVRLCWLCALPLVTSCVILVFACVEITKTGFEVGHSHGLSLLALARIGRAMSEVHAEAKEVIEAISHRLHPMSRVFIKVAFGGKSSLLACGLAVCCSMVECLRDSRFGAQHGLVILSLADLVHVLRTMPPFRGPVLVLGPVFSMGMTVAAMLCAGVELFADLRPGAHHGVAVLAIAHMVENARRFRHNRAAVAKVM